MTAWQEFDAQQYQRRYAALSQIETLKRKLALAQRDGRASKARRLQDKLEDTLFSAYRQMRAA